MFWSAVPKILKEGETTEKKGEQNGISMVVDRYEASHEAANSDVLLQGSAHNNVHYFFIFLFYFFEAANLMSSWRAPLKTT